MLAIKPDHVRRVSFASKLYPKLKTTLGLAATKSSDGEVFCGGRSVNRDLLAFFGFISQSQRGASTFVQLPLFRRSMKKLINLVETELEAIGAHEVLMPTLIPQKLWHKSKRVERQQDAFNNVYKLEDNSGNQLLLGPTFEESMAQLVGDNEPLIEHELPLMLYQMSQKFRDEPNPRFGLLRSNEFMMNDLYSFDTTLDKAKQSYATMASVYEKIFSRLSLGCLRFESNPGDIGGKYSHEYQLLVSSGEDTLVRCKSCQYSYNLEMLKLELGAANELTKDKCLKCYSTDLEHLQALELGHTFLLSDTYSKPLDVTIKCADGQRRHYEMGCYGLGLTRIIGAGIDLFSIVPKSSSSEESTFVQMRWPSEIEPFKLGIVTPAKRSKQYHGGSGEFVKRIVGGILEISNPNVDIIIEDLDKDGIFKRLTKLQCLGIPNIIVVGKRFVDDPPQVELLRLTPDKQTYEQLWLTEEQLFDYVKKEF